MKQFIFLFACILLLGACQKNDDVNTSSELKVDDATTVTASVQGIVVDENNIPVANAAVALGASSTITDGRGYFSFKNKTISKNNGWVKVAKTGYFIGNRTFVTIAGGTHNVRMKLLTKTNVGTIAGAGGGNVVLPSGAKLTLPASAVTDVAGAAYTGVVNVAMRYLDPTSADLPYTIPGDLRGVTTNNTERALETYGMLGVELTSATGQPLKIATGKTAELSFPIPAGLLTSAPATIKLWHFDETKGRWMEEGSATKVGNNYVGNVNHFSFWNCDAPFPLVNLCVTVTNPNGVPLNNAQVRIRRAAVTTSVGYGVTDSLGKVCGGVPKNEALVIEVLSNCGTVVFAQNVGPYSANSSATVVASIAASNMITVTGAVVNCSNAPVTNGYAQIYVSGGYTYFVPVNASGMFTVNILNCAGTTVSVNALAVDNTNQQQGTPITASSSGGSLNLGTLSACGSSSARFISLLVDGTPYSWASPADSIVSFGNSAGTSGFRFTASTGPSGFAPTCSFNSNTVTAIGSVTLNGGFLNVPPNGSSQQLITPATMTITEFGPVATGFISGNFTANFIFQPGTVTRTVTGNFRVRRPL